MVYNVYEYCTRLNLGHTTQNTNSMTDFSQNITQQYPIYTETGSRKDRSLIQLSSLSIQVLVKIESSVVVSVNMQREYL